MGALLRTTAGFITGFALLGVILTSALYPRFIAWNNTSAYGTGMCVCADTARQGAEAVIHAQLVGGSVGGGLGFVAGLAYALGRRKKAAAAAPAAPTPAPPA
jgi:hypothetical protein